MRSSAWSRTVPLNRTTAPQSGRTAQSAAAPTGSGSSVRAIQVSLDGGSTAQWYVGRRRTRPAVSAARPARILRSVESGDIFDDESSFRTPPPPDDRLWRHPSEMGWAEIPAKRSRAALTLVVASGVAGALIAVGVLAATGSLGTRVKAHQVVERVRPAVATTGTSDADA